MATHIITKDKLQQMIDTADKTPVPVEHHGQVIGYTTKQIQIIGRALVVLFNRQTAFEKQANTTNHHNNVGFTGADGKSGVLTAKSFLGKKTLQQWQVDRWTKKNDKGYCRLAKYWRQIDEAAKLKAAGGNNR